MAGYGLKLNQAGDERIEASVKEWDQNTGSGWNIKDGIRMLGKIMMPVAWVLSNLFPIPFFSSAETETVGGGYKEKACMLSVS